MISIGFLEIDLILAKDQHEEDGQHGDRRAERSGGLLI